MRIALSSGYSHGFNVPWEVAGGNKQMRETFKILRKLGNGEQLLVAISEELEKAKQLRESLNRHWPGNYLIQEMASTKDAK